MNFDFDKKQSKGNTQKSPIAISLSQMEKEDQAMLNRARYLASQITPDEAVEIKSLAEKNNITFELAKADKVRLKTDEMFKKMQDVRKQAPYFANLMGNETYASLTQDDIDNLMKIETNVVEKLWDVGRSLVAPIPDMAGGAIAGLFELYALKQRFDTYIMQNQLAMLKSLGQENTRVYRFYEKLVQLQDSNTKFWNEYAFNAKEAADNTLGAVSDFIRPNEKRQNFATKTAEVVGQIGAQYAMGPAGLAVMGLNSISSQQEIMRENGIYGTMKGDMATLGAAGLELLIERLQLGGHLEKANLGLGLKRRLIRAGVNMGSDAAEESLQSVSTDIINKYVAGVEKDWDDIGEDAVAAGIYGFAGSGIFSSLQGLVPSNRTQRKAGRLRQKRLKNGKKQNFLTDIVDYGRAVFNKKAGVMGNEEFQKFEKDGVIDDLKVADGVIADFANQATSTLFQEPLVVVLGLTELGDIADASTTLKRSPEVFADTINKITAKSGSDIVYLNAEDVKESFGENTGDLKAVLMQLNISEADFNAAAESGLDIKVKTGDYVAKLSKDEQLYDLMNGVARLKEDAHSMRDIERLIKRIEQDMKYSENEPKTQLSLREASAKEVFDTVFAALIDTKMDKMQADSIARIWATRANAATHGKDVLPMEWFKKATQGNLAAIQHGLSVQIRPDGVSHDKIEKQEDTVIQQIKEARKWMFMSDETSRLFLRDMMQTATDDPAANAQMETLKRWMGAKDGSVTEQMEEKFARAFEKYLMEGKAPEVELQSVFASFRQWFLEIYNNLFGIDLASGQTINMTPEIRVLFDTLLATDQQIKEARRVNAQDELLPQDYFQSKEEYQVYLENLQKANDDAFDEVVQRRARAITRMREKEYVKEFRGELENAKKEVAQMPTYQLIKALKEGTLKFNNALAQAYGHPIDKTWLDENGHAPEDIAQDFGYSSADAMLSEISTAKDAETVAAQIATESMMQRHDELFDELSIMDSAARSIYNQAYIENLIGEEIAIRGEKNATKTKDVLMKAIEAGGNNIINNATLTDATNVRKYAKQAIKAGEDYEDALRNNNKNKMLEAKHRQAITSYLVKRAYEAEEDIRKAESFFNEIKGCEKIIGTKYFEQIKGLMAKHGYWDTDFILKSDFNLFANGLREAGEPVPVVNPVLFEKHHSNYWNMSYSDFMALYEGIKSIYTVGRNSQVMLKEGKKQEIKALAESLANNIHAVTRPLGGKPVDPLKERSKWERFKDKLKDIESWLVKTEQIAIELDGGTQGAFYNEFYQRMSDAETKTALQLTEIDKQLAGIFKDYDAARLDMRFQIGNRELTMKQILMLGLNWGNEGNRMAILNSPYGLNEFNVHQALAKLNKSDWETIQKVWDLMENYRNAGFDLEERVTGVRPKAVVPEVVHTQYGDFRGGYFPIVFDPEKSSLVEDREFRRDMEGISENPQFRSITARGFLKARQGSVQPVLLNDLNVIKKYFTDLVTDLNYREAKVDMIRLLKNEDLAAAIRSRLGKEGLSNIQKWVLDAGTRKIPLNTADRIMDALRINAVKFSMAGNIKVMAIQFSGLGTTAAEVGGANTARWVGNYMSALASKKYREYGEFILSRSKFMQLRAQELDRDLKDFYNKNLGKSKAGIMIDNKVEFLLAGIQKMDFFVSGISWHAGYEKAVLEGKTEQEAINYADSVVRLTQGSGRGVDQSRIQRENSMWKIMTSFYSVFNVMYNRYRRAIRDVQQGKGYSRLVREAAYTWLTQSFMEATIRCLFDNDEKKKRGIAPHFAEQAVSQIFSTNPLTFYMSNSFGKIASNQSVGINDFTPHGFSALKSATQTVGAVVRGDPDFQKATKNAAVSFGQATGMISRSEINFMEALLRQIKEGYFNPMEYISGVQKK